VMDGTGESTAVPQFSFATPGPAPRGMAFDGEDVWIIDQVDQLVYQMEGKTAVVRNSFAVTFTVAGALDVDGTIVVLQNNTDDLVEFYTPTGTFLYSFPDPGALNTNLGISHQKDQWIISSSVDEIPVYA